MNLASVINGPPDDAVAVISRGKYTTYGELRAQVAAARGGLSRLGVAPGDRVAIVCANNWYFVVSYLATLGLGAVATPLNPLSPAAELERELMAVEASVVIAGPSSRRSVATIDRSRVTSLEHVITCGGEESGEDPTLDMVLQADPVPMVEVDSDDLAVLIFTSGTAGRPKAAMLSHGNIIANIEQISELEFDNRDSTDVTLGVLPLFHIYGLTVVIGLTFANGGSVVLIERFDPQSALTAIESHGVTVLPGVPAMWTAWVNMPDVPDDAFAGIRIATCGADRLPAEVSNRVGERFGLVIHEGYGLTEASPVVTTSVGEEAHVGSVGMPLPRVELRLVDLDGTDALVGDSGEIWVRGPNVFKGYWENPEATAEVLDESGWLHTGDLAVVDDAGYLSLVDRAKDLIIVSGFNVFPAEVEDVLIAHPGIDACAVVGVPHPYSGEAVKAFVVVNSSGSFEEDEIIEWCSDHLARYKCPEKVMFVDELPKGLSGKVLRRSLA